MEEIVKEGKISVITLLIRLFIVDIFSCCILVGFIWFVKDIIIFFTTKLIITNKRISGKTGLINANELDSPLNKINGIQIKQGLFGKIFNYGTISITTASTVFNFDYISSPYEFKTILNNQIEKYDEQRIEMQAKKMAQAINN